MLLLLMTQTIVWILASSMKGNLQNNIGEEGITGIWQWSIFFSLAAVMPFLIRRFNGKTFKWITFVITVLWTIIFLGTLFTESRAAYLNIMLITHDIIAVWTSIIAFKQAKWKEEK
jgi:hypothetical protein